MPKTKLGKWAGGLLVVFVVLAAVIIGSIAILIVIMEVVGSLSWRLTD